MVGRYKWRKPESMPVYEAMSSLYAMKHALRNVQNHSIRHIILTDSMTAAVAFTKGRAHSFRLRGVVEQASALQTMHGHTIPQPMGAKWSGTQLTGLVEGVFSLRLHAGFLAMIHRQLNVQVSWVAPKVEKKKPKTVESVAQPTSRLGVEAPLTWDIELEEGKAASKKTRRSARRKQQRREFIQAVPCGRPR